MVSEPYKTRGTAWMVFAIVQFALFAGCIYSAVQSCSIALPLFVAGAVVSILGMCYVLAIAAFESGAPGSSKV